MRLGTDAGTSAGQADVRIGVHEELHVEHVAHFLRVEDQDALEEDHVGRVHGDLVLQPGHRRRGRKI